VADELIDALKEMDVSFGFDVEWRRAERRRV
jgi:hypothetical protein